METKSQTRHMGAPSAVPAPPRGGRTPARRSAEPAPAAQPDVLPAALAALRDGVPEAEVVREIRACRLCAPRFALTRTAHAPRPVAWFRPGARLLIASQAPGMRAHLSGVPFSDPSGERLREWMGVTDEEFYDRSRVAIVPMGFCFPGYDRAGGDIPPPAVCAAQWRERALGALPGIETTLLVGGTAQAWHLGRGGVTDRVRAWRDLAPRVFALPHPSWRNTAWLKRNPWFEAEVLPSLRARVRELIDG